MGLDDKVIEILTTSLGRCYHTPPSEHGLWKEFAQCAKCGKYRDEALADRIDFSTWEGFGILLSWAKEQSWWYTFIGISSDGLAHDDWEALDIELVNPVAFAMAVYEELSKE